MSTDHFYENDPQRFLRDLQIRVGGEIRPFKEAMAPFQRLRFMDLMPAFLRVARGQTPEIGRHWWEATKGASKDSDLAAAILWLLAFSPRKHLHVQVGAADKDQAGELRRAAEQILALNEWLKRLVKIDQWTIANPHTKSECEIIASDVAGSQGARPDVLVLNELSCVRKQEFASNLMDNAAKVPGGVVVIATNAGFLGSWQFNWRELARNSTGLATGGRWPFHVFAEPAPWLAPHQIAEAKKRNTASRFNRLFMGVWQSGTGDAIDSDDVESCIVLDGPQAHHRSDSGWDSFAALDLGVKSDWSAITVLQGSWRYSGCRLADCRSWSPKQHGGRVNLEIVEREVDEMVDRLKILCLLYDPWQCEYLAARLKARGVNMVEFPFTAANTDLMAKSLMSCFRNREIALYRNAELIRDLCSMSLIEKSSGQYKLIASRDPARGHCDLGFSFAMAMSRAKDFICEKLSLDSQAQADRESAANQPGARGIGASGSRFSNYKLQDPLTFDNADYNRGQVWR